MATAARAPPTAARMLPSTPPTRSFAGHSKWHNIRQRKGAQDKRRAAMFSKAAAELESASKACSGDETNFRLQAAILKAKGVNMPKDSITKAVARGASGAGGEGETTRYEGMGPSAVAVIVECLTTSKNRTSKEIRHLFSKHGGMMESEGAVMWNFEHQGLVKLGMADEATGTAYEEEVLFEAGLEAGASCHNPNHGHGHKP